MMLEKEIINEIEYTVYRDYQNNIPYIFYINNITLSDISYFTRIICNQDGSPRYKKFFKNGHVHCDFGPAIISYVNNRITKERYYIEGVNVTEKEFYEKISLR